MRQKQMKKIAAEIAENELIRKMDSSTKEEKTQAEDRIIQLTKLVLCLPDGLNVMSDIDAEVQKILIKSLNMMGDKEVAKE